MEMEGMQTHREDKEHSQSAVSQRKASKQVYKGKEYKQSPYSNKTNKIWEDFSTIYQYLIPSLKNSRQLQQKSSRKWEEIIQQNE